jgi:glycerate kinase
MNAYKGTLTSLAVNQVIEKHLVTLGYDTVSLPMSDGGDGFLDAVSYNTNGSFVDVRTYDPLQKEITARYYVYNDKAYIELAKVSGLSLLNEEERTPLITSTYGLGIMIKDAIHRGIKRVCIGIGGSATHDGGAGMLQALGVKFYHQENLIEDMMCGHMLKDITSFDFSELKDLLSNISIDVITDVSNPLLGSKGAAFVYAAQKGASIDEIKALEESTKHFADLVETHLDKICRHLKGSGAAGGIGFGLSAFLNANLYSGIQYMIDLLDIEEHVKSADLIIVGEGKLDNQTAYGKAPYGISKLARKYHKKIIGIFASKDDHVKANYLDEVYVVVPKYASLKDSMNQPKSALLEAVKEIFT